MKSLIDAHCHLADPRLAPVLDEVMARARSRGIEFFIQGGVGPDDWSRQLELSFREKGILPAFGLHPWWVDQKGDEDCERALTELDQRLALSTQNGSPRVVGLGELGLDYGPRTHEESRDRQLRVFRSQLILAKKHGLPLVLHIVHAHEEAIAELKTADTAGRGGIVHAFTGGPGLARRYCELGLTLSIGGPVARKGFESLKRAVVTLRPNQFVLESDSPDQPPPGYALNEPASLWDVAEEVGRLRSEQASEVLQRSRDRLNEIFKLEL